jgi:hypothetical protein
MSFSIFTMLDDLDSATIRSVGSLPLFFNSLVFGHFKPSGFKTCSAQLHHLLQYPCQWSYRHGVSDQLERKRFSQRGQLVDDPR